MNLLKPDQFTLGFPSDPTPLMFFTSHKTSIPDALIVRAYDEWYAVDLGDPHLFKCVKISIRYRLDGAFVPGVAIEIDHTTIFDRYRDPAPLGSLFRRQDQLDIWANCQDRQGFFAEESLPIMDGLPEANDNSEVGFADWQIVLGEGDDKQVLYRRIASEDSAAEQ